MIGNLKKWKTGALKLHFRLNDKENELTAERICTEGEAWRIRFSWNNPVLSFSDVIEASGHTPLPPYISREDEKEDFDIILMDLHMPIMDGIEATRIIRNSENPKIKNIPIVALTAAIMSESHDKIHDLNINDYVLKPFKPHDLYSRISKHIR